MGMATAQELITRHPNLRMAVLEKESTLGRSNEFGVQLISEACVSQLLDCFIIFTFTSAV